MTSISLTKKDLKDLEDGLSIEIEIDGKPRVYVKHCDCKICKDFSEEFHEAYDPKDHNPDDGADDTIRNWLKSWKMSLGCMDNED
tara:strand:+ start:2036 stop:2290 length:255 start_codon:yes stop_codon:yes gene_type:complete